jgi:hypothetical protein
MASEGKETQRISQSTSTTPRSVLAGRLSRIVGWRPSAEVLILWALPWILLLLDRDWPYAALLHDPWIYLGHAIDPWGMIAKFNGVYHAQFYYASRLSIIMPVAAAHAILPALVANFLVRLVLFEVSVLCVLDLLSRHIGRKTGLLAAFVLGTNYFFLDAIGRDYSDAFAIAYILAAIWGVSRAGGSRGGLFAMAFAGASTVALVTANLAYVILTPIPIAYYAVTQARKRGAIGLALDMAALAMGALSLFALFCMFYYLATGDFWFLGPSVAFARWYERSISNWAYNGGTLFKFGDVAWIGWAVWLTLPIAVATLSGIVLVNQWVRHKVESDRLPRVWMVLFLCQFCVFLAMDSLTKTCIFLQAWFYASTLIPLTILALGSLIARVVESLDSRRFRVCFGLSALLLLAQTAIPVAYTFPNRATVQPLLLSVTPAFLALLLLMFVSKKRQRVMGTTVVLATTLLAVSSYLTRKGFREEMSCPLYAKSRATVEGPELSGSKPMRPLVQQMHRYDRQHGDFYASVVETLRYAKSFDKKDTLVFWFNMRDPHAMIYENLTCCRNFMISTINLSFPDLNKDKESMAVARIVPGSLIAILSVGGGTDRDGRQSLASVGLGSRLLGQKMIEHGKIRFTVRMVEVTARDAVEQAQSRPSHLR